MRGDGGNLDVERGKKPIIELEKGEEWRGNRGGHEGEKFLRY